MFDNTIGAKHGYRTPSTDQNQTRGVAPTGDLNGRNVEVARSGPNPRAARSTLDVGRKPLSQRTISCPGTAGAPPPVEWLSVKETARALEMIGPIRVLPEVASRYAAEPEPRLSFDGVGRLKERHAGARLSLAELNELIQKSDAPLLHIHSTPEQDAPLIKTDALFQAMIALKNAEHLRGSKDYYGQLKSFFSAARRRRRRRGACSKGFVRICRIKWSWPGTPVNRSAISKPDCGCWS